MLVMMCVIACYFIMRRGYDVVFYDVCFIMRWGYDVVG